MRKQLSMAIESLISMGVYLHCSWSINMLWYLLHIVNLTWIWYCNKLGSDNNNLRNECPNTFANYFWLRKSEWCWPVSGDYYAGSHAKERHQRPQCLQRPQAKSKVPPTAVVTAAAAVYWLRAVSHCPQTNVGRV